MLLRKLVVPVLTLIALSLTACPDPGDDDDATSIPPESSPTASPPSETPTATLVPPTSTPEGADSPTPFVTPTPEDRESPTPFVTPTPTAGPTPTAEPSPTPGAFVTPTPESTSTPGPTPTAEPPTPTPQPSTSTPEPPTPTPPPPTSTPEPPTPTPPPPTPSPEPPTPTPTPIPPTPTPLPPTPTPPTDADGDGYVASEDCDDGNVDIHPGASEICDGVDNDCSGSADDGLTFLDYYLDSDGDGYGAGDTLSSCQDVEGYAKAAGDCRDDDATIFPGAEERCDGVDNNCDDQVDEGLEVTTYYKDNDVDGYGDPDETLVYCTLPDGYVDNAADCDDGDENVNPDATETCNEIDDNCNEEIDEGVTSLFAADGDEDGFSSTETTEACVPPPGYIVPGSEIDCDDDSATVYPGADEYCNDIDDDCDGQVDLPNPVDGQTFYIDMDGDGFGSDADTVTACSVPEGYAANAFDCDDADIDAVPGTPTCPFFEGGISCNDILLAGLSKGDGVYIIQPDADAESFAVYCDMTTAGGGWTLIAKVSANDAQDRWGWMAEIYRDSSTLGEALDLSAQDAKSRAYSEVPGEAILIRDLARSAYAAHTYSSSSVTWADYVDLHWNDCGYPVSMSALELADDGRDSVIGPALYMRHFDGLVGNCDSQERAMFSESPYNAGWVETGIGITQGNAAYLDAQSGPAGSMQYGYNVSTQTEDYALFVR